MKTIQRCELTEAELNEIFDHGTLNGVIIEWDEHYTQATLIKD